MGNKWNKVGTSTNLYRKTTIICLFLYLSIMDSAVPTYLVPGRWQWARLLLHGIKHISDVTWLFNTPLPPLEIFSIYVQDMEHLLGSQIQDSCRLALPEGLQDLMCDISREVLRAQPTDLYQFIVDYLAAMLLVRDTLPIACRVCHDVCNSSCEPLLEEELRKIGLDGNDLKTAKNVVMEHFDKSEVSEGTLLMKLFNETQIEDNMLPAVQEAIRTAFLNHQQLHSNMSKAEPEDEGQKAAHHTLRFYENFSVDVEEQQAVRHKAASKIQAYFRGYVARRSLRKEFEDVHTKGSGAAMKETDSAKATTSKPRSHPSWISSTVLAGSQINFPNYDRHLEHDITHAGFEHNEKENKTIDYTLSIHSKDLNIDEGKKISFHEQFSLHKIESYSVEEEEGEDCVEEEIIEDVKSEASSIDEMIIKDETQFTKNQEPKLLANVTDNEKHIAEDIVDVINENILPPVKINNDYKTVKGVQNVKSLDDEIKLVDVVNKCVIKIVVEEYVDKKFTTNEAFKVLEIDKEKDDRNRNKHDECSMIKEHGTSKEKLAVIVDDARFQYEQNSKTISDHKVIEEYETSNDNRTKLQDDDKNELNKLKSFKLETLSVPITSEVQMKASYKKTSSMNEEIIIQFDDKMTGHEIPRGRKDSDNVNVKQKRLSNPPYKIVDREGLNETIHNSNSTIADLPLKPNNITTKEVGSNESFFEKNIEDTRKSSTKDS